MDNLSDRKKRILRAVIDNYIETAMPVSSSEIQKQYLSDVSSATIRSELAGLEELGYLNQPHISAGRVPASKAYKYYVENCLDAEDQSGVIKELKDSFKGKLSDIESVMRETAKILSDVTNYTSIVVLDNKNDFQIRSIKLVDLGCHEALVIIITNAGVLKDNIISLPKNLSSKYLEMANNVLNEIFSGRCISEIDEIKVEEGIKIAVTDIKLIFDELCLVFEKYCQTRKKMMYLEGQDNIFKHKEGEDINKVKNFMQLLSREDKLDKIISNDSGVSIDIKIGSEDLDALEDMAVVTAKYSINGVDIAKAGVLGPERMDYKKVIKALEQIKNTLESINDEKENEDE